MYLVGNLNSIFKFYDLKSINYENNIVIFLVYLDFEFEILKRRKLEGIKTLTNIVFCFINSIIFIKLNYLLENNKYIIFFKHKPILKN